MNTSKIGEDLIDKKQIESNEKEELKDLKLEDIPPAPISPETDECCGSGCIRCVYDIYEIQLDQYKTLVAKIEERNKQKLERIKQLNSNSSSSSKQDEGIISTNSNNNDNNDNNINQDNGNDLIIEYVEGEGSNNDTPNELATTPTATIKEMKYLLNGLFENDLMIGKIESYKVLSGEGSPNRIYHLDIKSIEKEVQYRPGDYISILAPNESDLINKLLKRLKLGNGLQKIKIKSSNTSNISSKKFNHLPITTTSSDSSTTTIYDLFKWVLNLTYIPPQFFLKILSEFCKNEQEKLKLVYLSSPQGTQLYQETIVDHKINLVSLLIKFKSCEITLKDLLINVPPHETRKYSISSSPLLSGNYNIHITFNLVKIISNNNNNNNNNSNNENNKVIKEKFGLCTHWMYNQIQLFKQLTEHNYQHINSSTDSSNNNIPSVYLPFSIQKSNNQFNLPNNLSTPIILIATGTGLAPFRSFLHHRYYQIQDFKQQQQQQQHDQSAGEIGECLLFFGCKRRDWDQIYSDELNQFKNENIISKLFISYSQQSQPLSISQQLKEQQIGYINKIIFENGELIYNLIVNKNAIIYVCGNKNKIGKSINETLIEIIKKFNNFNIKSDQEAELLIDNWIKSGIYKRDVWN